MSTCGMSCACLCDHREVRMVGRGVYVVVPMGSPRVPGEIDTDAMQEASR